MGIRGLLKYLKKHPEIRERRVSLGRLAEQIKEKTTDTESVTLLCDYFCVFFWLLREFHEAKIKKGDCQPYSYIYGGDLLEYETRFLEFVRVLRQVGVEPIFFVDGPKGSDKKGFHAKLPTNVSRHIRQIETAEHCIKLCNYDPKETPDGYSIWIPHPLFSTHILMALKSEGVKIEYCYGEADAYLAKQVAESGGVTCGILTNDTDMVLMRNCEVLLCQFFDRDETLGIRSVDFNTSQRDIRCEIVTPAGLAKVLRIPEDDLINFSIICGNDYTAGLNALNVLHEKLELGRFHERFDNAAKWLRETPHEPLHETPPFDEICLKTKGEYKRAIDYTHASSSVSLSDLVCGNGTDSPLCDMVCSEVKEGRMMRHLLSIVTNSIYWRGSVVEDIEGDHPIYDLLLPIRKVFYKLLGLQNVKEYGHTKGSMFEEIHVRVKHSNPSLLPELRQRNMLDRICHLVTFLSKANSLTDTSICLSPHQGQTGTAQSDSTISVVSKILRPLCVCACVLFARDLEIASTAAIVQELSSDVFLVTCCMCFLKKPPRRVHSRPSQVAITAATGFALMMEHLYILASLLGLFEFMPRPGELYQMVALVAYYHVAETKRSDIKHKLRVNQELAETFHAYAYITKDLRSFRQLKKKLSEVYDNSKSDRSGVFRMDEMIQLAIAFLEVAAAIDEVDHKHELFRGEELPGAHHGKHPKKGKPKAKAKTKATPSSGASLKGDSEYTSPIRSDIEELKREMVVLTTRGTDSSPVTSGTNSVPSGDSALASSSQQ